jgi:hypothetical protein
MEECERARRDWHVDQGGSGNLSKTKLPIVSSSQCEQVRCGEIMKALESVRRGIISQYDATMQIETPKGSFNNPTNRAPCFSTIFSGNN